MSLARAIASGDLAELPSRRDEDWRWSDIRGLVRTLPEASPPQSGALASGPFAAVTVEQIEIVNGGGPERLVVAAGERRCLALRYVAVDDGTHASKLFIELGEGAELTLLESHEGEAGAVSAADIDVLVGAKARLERIVLAEEGGEAVSVSMARIDLAPGAAFAQTVVTNGARRQRIETRVRHGGGDGRARLDGLYLIDGKRHADITTLVTHERPGGLTDQLTKGVVSDQGRGVFQGRIEVRPGADRTDAKMGHHALVLSDRAEVDAKPELEIYADDVSCSHGNTVGALDEEALFYASQRGIPQPQARAMLTEAFVAEVVGRIGHDGARTIVRDWVAGRTTALQ